MLYRGNGWGEHAVRLLNAPEGVTAEGIDTTAVEIIFPGKSRFEWVCDVILPTVGIDGEPADQLLRLSRAGRMLRYISGNAAILYHTGKLNKEQTLDYYQTYAMVDEKRAEQSFSFITHPLFRAYTFTYTTGYDLITEAARGNKTPVFLALLKDGILPSEIVGLGQVPGNSKS
jgi:hypothetical protein